MISADQEDPLEKQKEAHHVSENENASDLNWLRRRYSSWRIPVIVIGGIAIAEIIAMIVVYYFQHLPYYQQVLLDAVVMTAIITPLLYFLSFKPLLAHIQQRYQTENITQTRLRLMQSAHTQTLDDLMQATLNEVEALTGSTIGYFHFLEADQKTLSLQTWSTNTLQNMCTASGKNSHYPVEQAGVWADCIRERRPVIHNNYSALSHRKGLPEGHAAIQREMAVPIIRNGKIVAIIGIGNKPQDFTPGDVALVATLADFAWDVIQHKQAENAIIKSEDKFRTLVDWTFDWEIWIDPQGLINYTSPSCERITGFKPAEFIADPDLLIRIVHPEDRADYTEHHAIIHDQEAAAMSVEYRLIARDNTEHWIEHVCRPLYGAERRYLGRRVSNRDITERKRIEAEIRERNQKEKMLTTMIHNMQLDIARDLHDTIGQNISYLRMKLDHLSEHALPTTANLQDEIRKMSRVAEESYDLVRGTLTLLQSQNSLDLFNMFKRYAGQVAERAEFEIEFLNNGETRPLSALQIRQLFYIFREALNNIEKHAQASYVRVETHWEEDRLSLTVVDNGQGFDHVRTQPQGTHYGLRFMRERAEMLSGSLTVQTTLKAGTRLIVQVPLQPAQPEQ